MGIIQKMLNANMYFKCRLYRYVHVVIYGKRRIILDITFCSYSALTVVRALNKAMWAVEMH